MPNKISAPAIRKSRIEKGCKKPVKTEDSMLEEPLTERVVRIGDVFCSLLFDHENSTLRVVDFFGGNHLRKQRYIERLRSKEGFRKVFTLVERAEVAGWRQAGYQREGTIPGYYKRSDAHVMSRIFATNINEATDLCEMDRRGAFLSGLAAEGEKQAALKAGPAWSEKVDRGEAYDSITAELARLRSNVADDGGHLRVPEGAAAAMFGQFGRNAERHYWIVRHRKTTQSNVFGAEYQDCFGNAKVDMFFTPGNRAGRALACLGLHDFLCRLSKVGAVSVFALVRADDPVQNLLYCAAGFQSGGWMRQQVIRDGAPVDQVLWSKRI